MIFATVLALTAGGLVAYTDWLTRTHTIWRPEMDAYQQRRSQRVAPVDWDAYADAFRCARRLTLDRVGARPAGVL